MENTLRTKYFKTVILILALLISSILCMHAQSAPDATADQPAPSQQFSSDTSAMEQPSNQEDEPESEPEPEPEPEPEEYENLSEQALQEAMGYELIQTPSGPNLVYNPKKDRTHSDDFQPSSILASYMDMQKRQTQELFHSFLITHLTPVQRKLLQEYLIEQLTQAPYPGADEMAGELQSEELSPQSTAYITRVVIALYYYHTYIYEPLVDYADNVTHAGQEGLVMPHIIAMSQHLLGQFPNSQPLSNLLLVAPIAAQLFYRHYSSGQTSMALASSSYAVLLGLSAQFSAGILSRFTNFNSYSAGMLASTWRNFSHQKYMQASIDGTFTLLHLKNKRGLIYSAIGAALMHALTSKLPQPNIYTTYLDANHMLPIILSACLTEDWTSTFITGATLLLNQYALYRPRSLFLVPGQIYGRNEPHWTGIIGSALMAAATTYIYWGEMPSLSESGQAVTSIANEIADWISYLTFMKGTVRPDQERSGIIQALTRKFATYTAPSTRYHGEKTVEAEHTFGSQAEAILGNQDSDFSGLSEWMSWFMGYHDDRSHGTTMTQGANQPEREEALDGEDLLDQDLYDDTYSDANTEQIESVPGEDS